MSSKDPVSRIRREIKQTRPFRSGRQEAMVALLRTAEVVRDRLETVLAQYGLTTQQYNVLRILRGAHPKALPTMEIAERMVERTPGVTRLLDRLERKELVARERSREDRRQVLCTVTPKALDLLASMDPEADRADEDALGDTSEREVRELIRLLDKVRRPTSSAVRTP